MNAVIFDLDGTLVDSFEAHYVSLAQAFKERDIDMPRADFKRLFGKLARVIIHDFLEEQGLDADWNICDDISARKQELFREKNVGLVTVFPGVTAFLDELGKDGFHMAVASNSPRRNIEAMLSATGLAERFEAIVAVDEIERPKPDPQMFLQAARDLDVGPSDCLVVEDSVHGLEAAKRAGMPAIAVLTGGGTRDLMAGAEMVVDDLRSASAADAQGLIQKNR